MAAAISNFATAVETVTGTTHTLSLTVSAGASRKVVLCVAKEASITGVAATFDGNSMTSITSANHTADSTLSQLWFYYDLSDGYGTGSKTISVTHTTNTAAITLSAWQLAEVAAGAAEYGAIVESAATSTASTSNTGVTVTAGAIVLACGLNGAATPTADTWGTVTERTENNEANYTTALADATGVTAGTKTVSVTWSSTSGNKLLGVVSVAAGASSGLSDVDTDETITTGQASVAYTGTGLASADAMLVKTGTKSASGTSFSATNATSGTFTAPSLSAVRTGGVKFGSVTFEVKQSTTSLGTLAGTLNPETGWTVHNVTDISQAADTGCLYYGQSPAVAVGDQVLFKSTTATNAWAVTVDTQGFFTVDSGGSTAKTSFDYYVFDATDETWGAIGTITINEDADPGFSAGSGRALVRPIVRAIAK